MNKARVKATGLLVAGLLVTGVALTRPADVLAACYGVRVDYSSSPALQDIVGSKIVCPGYPIQYDLPDYTETPWYTETPVICPCPGSGGGGGGLGGNPWDEEAPGG